MNHIINIIGISGSLCIGLSFIPQTYHTIKTKKTEDLSKIFLGITMLGSSGVLTYGIYYTIIPIIITNTMVCINTTILFLYTIRNKNQPIREADLNLDLDLDLDI